MFKFNTILIYIFISLGVIFSASAQRESVKEGGPEARIEYEKNLLKNPNTGRIPEGIFTKERYFAEGLPKFSKIAKYKRGGIWDNVSFQSRGPYNVGGRTRAVAIDVTNENIILAGGVSGGVWRSVDGGQNWVKTTAPHQLQSVTSIAQDPRPGFTHLWYYTTGEAQGSAARIFPGDGIYKSEDGGLSWEVLENTVSGTPQNELDGDFDITFRVVVNPVNGDIYVASLGKIFKSTDFGAEWRLVFRSSNITRNSFTDIACSPNGILYASGAKIHAGLAQTNRLEGFFRSEDGENWVSITPADYNENMFIFRTVIDIAPSNENIVYFYSYGLGRSPGEANYNGLTLLKYNASNNIWERKNANNSILPNVNSQSNYNILLKVHPEDENTLILGGTEMFRSTDFFTNAENLHKIGGYGNSSFDYSYPNAHPDFHLGIFYPSNPNKMIVSHDGGLSLTENILADQSTRTPVVWASLNNGYFTTHPYSVAIRENVFNDPFILSGFQDNGSWSSNSLASDKFWKEEALADGMTCHILNDRTRLVSIQGGRVYRNTYNEHGDLLNQYRFLLSGYLFVHPFAADPNNPNIFYYPYGYIQIARQDDALNGDSRFFPDNFSIPDNGTNVITAVSVSTNPANTLFCGTDDGLLYKFVNANSDNPLIENITGNNFPRGYISCIAVDPLNADNIFVCFSNYEVQSIFQSTNGGQNWQNISGNLEENENGSGNGPSVRWIEVHRLSGQEDYMLLAGTSVGLYAIVSSDLNVDENPEWYQIGEETIGKTPVTMVKAREDGFVAVAAHGNGLFSGYVGRQPSSVKVASALEDIYVYENSEPVSIDFSNVFLNTSNNAIRYQQLNSNDRICALRIEGNNLIITPEENEIGSTQITLIADNGEAAVNESFRFIIQARPEENILFDQTEHIYFDYQQMQYTSYATVDTDIDFEEHNAFSVADNFNIPEGQIWQLEEVYFNGGIYNAVTGVFLTQDVFINIYNDENNRPGNLLHHELIPQENIVTDGVSIPLYGGYQPNTAFTLSLSDEIELSSGRYWISIQPLINTNEVDNIVSFWVKSITDDETKGHVIQERINSGNNTHQLELHGLADNMAFKLYGNIVTNASYNTPNLLSLSSDQEKNILLTWEEARDIPPVWGYEIQRSINEEAFRTITHIQDKSALSYMDRSEKIDGATYTYRIRTFGLLDNSLFSNEKAITIYPKPEGNILLTGNVNDQIIHLSWEDNIANQDGYLIEVATIDNDIAFAEISRTQERELSLPNLIEGQNYFFRIRAYNSTGVSEASNTVNYALSLTPPSELMAIKNNDNHIELTWRDNSNWETGYEVYKSIMDNELGERVAVLGINQASFIDEDIAAGSNYFYQVRAINGVSQSVFSNTASIEIAQVAGISNLSVQLVDLHVLLTWEDSDPEWALAEKHYEIYRSEQADQVGVLLGRSPNGATNFSDADIFSGNTYYYRVIAVHATGKSTFSDVVSITLDEDWALGMDDWLNEQIKLYPNPAIDKVLISLPKETVRYSLHLFDHTGRCVALAQGANKLLHEWSIHHLAKGVYTIKIQTDQGSIYKKLIKN